MDWKRTFLVGLCTALGAVASAQDDARAKERAQTAERAANARQEQEAKERDRAANAREQAEQKRIQEARSENERAENARRGLVEATEKEIVALEKLHRERQARLDRLVRIYRDKQEIDKLHELERLREREGKRYANAMRLAMGKLPEADRQRVEGWIAGVGLPPRPDASRRGEEVDGERAGRERAERERAERERAERERAERERAESARREREQPPGKDERRG
jgi:hypothetical protein